MTALEQAALEFAMAYLTRLVHDGPGYPVAEARVRLEHAATEYAREKVLKTLAPK